MVSASMTRDASRSVPAIGAVRALGRPPAEEGGLLRPCRRRLLPVRASASPSPGADRDRATAVGLAMTAHEEPGRDPAGVLGWLPVREPGAGTLTLGDVRQSSTTGERVHPLGRGADLRIEGGGSNDMLRRPRAAGMGGCAPV